MARSPEYASNHFSPLTSSLGESGFLPHRPMSAGIDSITQGFRFAAPAKKPQIATGVGGVEVQATKFGTPNRERIGNDAEIGGSGGSGGMNPNGMESLKVSVPIFSSTPVLHSSSPQLPPIAAAVTFAAGDEQMMLPPSPSPRLNDRGRNNRMVKEKRKRSDGFSSHMPDAGGCTQPSYGKLLTQDNNGRQERFEIPNSRDGGSRNEGRRAGISGSQSDQRRPKKTRQDRPEDSSRSAFLAPVDRSKGPEIIVLDDDVKVEPEEADTSMILPCEKLLSDNHDMNTGAPARNSESLQRRGTFQVYADQPTKHHALQSKDSNRRIGAGPSVPNEITGASNSQSQAGVGRVNNQVPRSNRSSVSSNSVMRKRPMSNGHIVESQSQQPNPKITLISSVTPISQGEQEQNSTGEHRLLVALTTLTTEKQTLEKKLHETMVSLKTQVFRAESSERKNAELEAQIRTSKENVAVLKKKMIGFQKFMDGLGKDYNMLSEKNSQISHRLDEVSRDRNELFKELQNAKFLAEKVDGMVQEWGSSGAMLKDANREVEKLNETLKFLHSQLSENAGLLAAERDRTQSLESQIQEDREKNKVFLVAIQDGKLELAEKLTELQKAFETNTEVELEEKLTELQKAIATKIEADGEMTRNSVGKCFKVVEKLRDREVDAVECLIGVEKRINHTSDSIMGLFHETHQMNVEALSFTDGYTGHLNSRIKDLEAESSEMREKYEVLLVASAEKRQLEKELEKQLKTAMNSCNEMNGQVEKGKMAENCLNESISMLQKRLAILERRPAEDLTTTEAMGTLNQKNCELQKECELARNDARDANLSLQVKESELENLRTELQSLIKKLKESEERIEGFENEKANFMARADEQKMKERIEVETTANMFRQRETSRLNNQIKALEAQKERLETENRGLKAVAAETSELKEEITKLKKKCAAIEKAHLKLTQEKTQLENLIQHSTQLEAATRSGYSILEERTGAAAEDLTKALEQINILQQNKQLMSQEIHSKQQELERANSEKHELKMVAEDVTALRTTEIQLRNALDEAEAKNGITRREKEEAVHAYQALEEKIKLLEEEFEGLKGANEELENRNSNAMASLNEEVEALKRSNEELMKAKEGATEKLENISKSNPGKMETEIPAEGHNAKQQIKEKFVVLAETSAESWDDSQPLSPFTPLERILETQMDTSRADDTVGLENEVWSNFSRIDNAKFERYLFGDDDDMVNVRDLAKDVLESPSRAGGRAEELLPGTQATSLIKGIKKAPQISQPRKNMATKFTSHRRTPSIVPSGINDQAAVIEDFSDNEDKVAGVGVLLPPSTYLEQAGFMPLTPKSRVLEKESKSKYFGNPEGTPVERHSFTPVTPLNKPKTPQRNDHRGGLADDFRKIQHRPRKERGKKNRDDQEWVEEEGELVRNNKGKEDTPNMKKNLRSYKERKKGGKRPI